MFSLWITFGQFMQRRSKRWKVDILKAGTYVATRPSSSRRILTSSLMLRALLSQICVISGLNRAQSAADAPARPVTVEEDIVVDIIGNQAALRKIQL